MLDMPAGLRCLAVDLQRYGKNRGPAIDARGGPKIGPMTCSPIAASWKFAQAHLLGWVCCAAAVLQFCPLNQAAMVLSLHIGLRR